MIFYHFADAALRRFSAPHFDISPAYHQYRFAIIRAIAATPPFFTLRMTGITPLSPRHRCRFIFRRRFIFAAIERYCQILSPVAAILPLAYLLTTRQAFAIFAIYFLIFSPQPLFCLSAIDIDTRHFIVDGFILIFFAAI